MTAYLTDGWWVEQRGGWRRCESFRQAVTLHDGGCGVPRLVQHGEFEPFGASFRRVSEYCSDLLGNGFSGAALTG